MMLNQQQNEHDDQHQADNAAGTVPPAPASGKRAHEEDDQQNEEDGGKHGGTPVAHDPEKWVPVFGRDHAPARRAHNAHAVRSVPLRAVRSPDLEAPLTTTI
jgi:hypothetical protein